tara:strand:- start:34 stop:684 length:651 start_codon:yes stop_codon:yes gene_type:complete
MKTFKVLNLYAGIGGNRYLWDGIPDLQITAVELNPKIAHLYTQMHPNDNLIIGDAHEYLINNFEKYDFIWSSPPCPSHSKMMKATDHKIHKYPDFKLYEEVVFLDNFYKGKYVIENVVPYYKPLIPAQKRNRHLYWANFKIPHIEIPKLKDFSRVNRSQIAEWLGFDYPGKNVYIDGCHDPVKPLRNCVHPIEGLTILKAALSIIEDNNVKQSKLF